MSKDFQLPDNHITKLNYAHSFVIRNVNTNPNSRQLQFSGLRFLSNQLLAINKYNIPILH
jgi:hypothetical protein